MVVGWGWGAGGLVVMNWLDGNDVTAVMGGIAGQECEDGLGRRGGTGIAGIPPRPYFRHNVYCTLRLVSFCRCPFGYMYSIDGSSGAHTTTKDDGTRSWRAERVSDGGDVWTRASGYSLPAFNTLASLRSLPRDVSHSCRFDHCSRGTLGLENLVDGGVRISGYHGHRFHCASF